MHRRDTCSWFLSLGTLLLACNMSSAQRPNGDQQTSSADDPSSTIPENTTVSTTESTCESNSTDEEIEESSGEETWWDTSVANLAPTRKFLFFGISSAPASDRRECLYAYQSDQPPRQIYCSEPVDSVGRAQNALAEDEDYSLFIDYETPREGTKTLLVTVEEPITDDYPQSVLRIDLATGSADGVYSISTATQGDGTIARIDSVLSLDDKRFVVRTISELDGPSRC